MKSLCLDKSYLYIKFIYFIRYFGDALFYSFTVLYLSSLGFEEGLIGNIQSIITITALVVNPIWSIIARNNKIAKILMILLSIIEGFFIIIYGHQSTVEVIMVITALTAIAAAPFYTMLDGYSATYCDQNNKEFPNVRVVGSLAYVCGTFLGGILIDAISFTNVFIIAGIFFIASGSLISCFKNLTILDDRGKQKNRNYRAIVSNKRYLFYLVSYILIVTISVLGDSYISLYFTKLQGLSVSDYSLVSSGILLTEVITILLMGKLGKNIKLEKLIIIAGLIYFSRSFILSFTFLPLFLLILASFLRGIAWGIIIYTHMNYLIRLVGLENVTTAAMLIVIVGSIISFILSNVIGYMIEAWGYNIFYLSISLVILSITIVNIIYYLKTRNKNFSNI